MAIRHWPAGERPREKLMQQGAGSLSDAELLAIFLRVGCRGQSAVDLARDLLVEFGSLRAISEAETDQFCEAKGLGLAKYCQLQAVMEMAKRCLRESLVTGDVFDSPSATRHFLQAHMRAQPREVFAVLFLNSQHALLRFEEMFSGTIDSAAVYPREIVRKAIEHRAAAVILAHNHPSGVAEPSKADERITQRIIDALQLIDVRVLDHMIVGDKEVRSMAELGLV